jgi:hypothetical protein
LLDIAEVAEALAVDLDTGVVFGGGGTPARGGWAQ